MKCVKIISKGVVEVREVPMPVPKDGEVLVKMKASALCRSDLARYHGGRMFEDENPEDIITPGHEPCGVVETVGPNVKNIKPGDRVAIYLGLGCGTCEYCLHGDINMCDEFRCIGFAVDGAHADYIVVPEYNCLPLPVEMDFITGALSTDVAGTLYTACRRLGVNGRKTVAILGLGPMGSGGILIAKALGAKVIAIDVNESRLALAKELGADCTINSGCDDVLSVIREKTHGLGVDVAIDCSGNAAAENLAIDCTKKQGKVGFIGENSDCSFNISLQILRKLLVIKGCWYFNRGDWEEISRFIVDNKIPLKKISTNTFTIEEADEAFRLFDAGKTQKVVFVWD